MRYATLPLVLLAAACTPTQSDQIMNIVEAQVRMPAGARPLTEYKRYYYRDGSMIIGKYLRSGAPGREWISKEKRKLVFDGGCGVVNVTFSLEANKIISVDCNGVS